jgi:hypothetical protein
LSQQIILLGDDASLIQKTDGTGSRAAM